MAMGLDGTGMTTFSLPRLLGGVGPLSSLPMALKALGEQVAKPWRRYSKSIGSSARQEFCCDDSSCPCRQHSAATLAPACRGGLGCWYGARPSVQLRPRRPPLRC